MAQCPHHLSLKKPHNPVHRFPRLGPLGQVPQLPRCYQWTPTPRLPSRLASLPSLGGTTRCSSSLPGPEQIPGAWTISTAAPAPPVQVEKTRPPRFLGDPYLHAPLFDPGGPPAPGLFRASHVAFRIVNYVGSALVLSRLYHAAYRIPVYASQSGSLPDHATLGSGWWPAFAGSGLSPAGSHRRFPSWLSVYMASPFTKLCLAQ